MSFLFVSRGHIVLEMRTSFLLCAVCARRARVLQQSVSDMLLRDVEYGVVYHWEDSTL